MTNKHELSELLASAAKELEKYIASYNRELGNLISHDDLDPPDYHDYETVCLLNKASAELKQKNNKHELSEEQIKEAWENTPGQKNFFQTIDAFKVGMKAGFELGQKADKWEHIKPSIEGFYLIRSAGRTQPELVKVRYGHIEKELCLFSGNPFDFFGKLSSLSDSIEWLFIESLPQPPGERRG